MFVSMFTNIICISCKGSFFYLHVTDVGIVIKGKLISTYKK